MTEVTLTLVCWVPMDVLYSVARACFATRGPSICNSYSGLERAPSEFQVLY